MVSSLQLESLGRFSGKIREKAVSILHEREYYIISSQRSK